MFEDDSALFVGFSVVLKFNHQNLFEIDQGMGSKEIKDPPIHQLKKKNFKQFARRIFFFIQFHLIYVNP